MVIEDFHYLSLDERRKFAFDMKALWGYGVFLVIVGVWSEQNLLTFLNRDLSGRVREVPIVWTHDDLARILRRVALRSPSSSRRSSRTGPLLIVSGTLGSCSGSSSGHWMS